MSSHVLPDGTVMTSSQIDDPELYKDQMITTPMLGVILSVQPVDNEDNFSSGITSSRIGNRHECTVYITDSSMQPNLILDNVVIPPQRHSGIDNFEEDLPRGLIRTLNGQPLSEQLENLSFQDLDAEWCVVQFIGGNIDRPYIATWWHHPANVVDPATSGRQLDAGTTLKQVDVNKNKFRYFRRLNGAHIVVSGEGDLYLDTNDANSSVEVQPEPKRMRKSTGGDIQIDVKKSRQFEINFNDPVEGLKAGSTSEREPALPHTNKTISHSPPSRSTSRTRIRSKQSDVDIRTSKLNIVARQGGGFNGDMEVEVDDLYRNVSNRYRAIAAENYEVETPTCKFTATDNIYLNTPETDLSDVPTDFILKGTSYNEAMKVLLTGINTFFQTMQSDWLSQSPAPWAPSNAVFNSLGTLIAQIALYVASANNLVSEKVRTG